MHSRSRLRCRAGGGGSGGGGGDCCWEAPSGAGGCSVLSSGDVLHAPTADGVNSARLPGRGSQAPCRRGAAAVRAACGRLQGLAALIARRGAGQACGVQARDAACALIRPAHLRRPYSSM